MLYELSRLTQIYKERKVLNIEHFSIEKGKIYALVGANGAGKSTLLNLLAFLEKPTSGEILCCGKPVQYQRQQLLNLRRRIVLIDQYPIHFTGSVRQNVAFGLKVRGVSRKTREKRVEEVLKLVGMEEFRGQDSRKLSGGESKRIALARALAIEPEVLLCDELTANVDIENREIILHILKKINEESKTSIIVATHYLAQIRHLAHHTLILENGSLVKKMKENIFRCQRIKNEGGVFICELNNEVNISLSQNRFFGIKKYCKIYIDPKGIKFLAKDGQTKEINVLIGQIIQIEKKQDAICLIIDCGIKLHAMITMDEYLQQQLMIGEKRSVYFFDTSILML